MSEAGNSTQRTPGERLREFRLAYGMTIKQLAEKIGGGAHFTTISKLERGVMAMSLDWAERIAQVLPIEPLQLISDDYGERQFRSVPLYFWYSWTPEGGIVKARNLGWIPTMGGGGNAFALGFYPAKEFEEISELGLNSVIDPNQRTLKPGYIYAIYFNADTGPVIGAFRLDPPRFELVDGGGVVILGHENIIVIGRVVFQCRTFVDS